MEKHLVPGGGAAASPGALLHAAQAAPLQLPHTPRLLPQRRHLLLERLDGLEAHDTRLPHAERPSRAGKAIANHTALWHGSIMLRLGEQGMTTDDKKPEF